MALPKFIITMDGTHGLMGGHHKRDSTYMNY